jgi:hypothetical protein
MPLYCSKPNWEPLYVEVHGDGGSGNASYTSFRPRGIGTAANPVWYVGVNTPIINATIDIGSFSASPLTSYLIFDGFAIRQVTGSAVDVRPRFSGHTIDHIVLRNIDANGTNQTANGSGFAVGATTPGSDETLSDILVYNSSIYNYGNKAQPGEECGVAPHDNLRELFIAVFLSGNRRIYGRSEWRHGL